jgi:hypothetical protein
MIITLNSFTFAPLALRHLVTTVLIFFGTGRCFNAQKVIYNWEIKGEHRVVFTVGHEAHYRITYSKNKTKGDVGASVTYKAKAKALTFNVQP